MNQQFSDIHKAAAILIIDRKTVLTRTKDKKVFVSPGGKLKAGETEIQACIREVKEELKIDVNETDLEYINTYYAEAAGDSAKVIKMSVYFVHAFHGVISADNEIEEIAYVGSVIPDDMEVGSIFLYNIIPYLKFHDLID